MENQILISAKVVPIYDIFKSFKIKKMQFFTLFLFRVD